MRRNVQVFYVLEEDFDSCGVLVVSVASEQELPHADRISPKLETSVALETVCNSVGCHVAIIDQWAATSGHSVDRPPAPLVPYGHASGRRTDATSGTLGRGELATNEQTPVSTPGVPRPVCMRRTNRHFGIAQGDNHYYAGSICRDA